MILFTAPDCAGCDRVKARLHFDQIVDISTDEGFEHARRLRVRSVPTVIHHDIMIVGEKAIIERFVEKL